MSAAPILLDPSVVADLLVEVRALRAEIHEMKSTAALLMAPKPQPKLLNAAAAARRLGIDPKTLRKAIDAGRVRTVLVDKRSMVPASEIDRLSKPAEPINPAPPRAERDRKVSGNKSRSSKSTYSVDEELARLDELLGRGKKK